MKLRLIQGNSSPALLRMKIISLKLSAREVPMLTIKIIFFFSTAKSKNLKEEKTRNEDPIISRALVSFSLL